MTTFSEKEKIQLLADIVELQTENNNEIDVCNYLKDLFDKYDIKSEILKVNEHRANIVAEIGNGSPILALSGRMLLMQEIKIIGLIPLFNSQKKLANYTVEAQRI